MYSNGPPRVSTPGRLRMAMVMLLVLASVTVVSAGEASAGAVGDPVESSGDGADAGAVSDRATCDKAGGVFVALCEAYELISTGYVDPVDDLPLGSKAADAVREAGLAARTDGEPPACPVPTPDFEEVCEQIDAVADTASAVRAAISGMTSLLDRNSFFWTGEQRESYLLEAYPPRIGVELSLLDGDEPCEAVSATCRPVISQVHSYGPAAEAGLMEGDIVTGLNDPIPPGLGCADLSGLDSFDDREPVEVEAKRGAETITVSLEATRFSIPIYRGRVVDGTIGYLRLDSFDPPASRGVQRVLHSLLQSGIETLVFDLRNNPGGDLWSTINILGLFLKGGAVITYTEDRSDYDAVQTQPSAEPLSDSGRLPMVVVVDQRSASAAEIAAGALRDLGRAVVVGQKTYGKYTGQNHYPLLNEDGSELGVLHLTTSRWYTPSGESVEGGLVPDLVMDLPLCLHPAEVARQAVAALQPPPLPAVGDRLIYDSDHDGLDYEMYLLDLAAGTEHQVTDNHSHDGISDWSPDGTRIAYESYRDGWDYEIYILDLTTGTERRVTDNYYNDNAPVWSPDGTRIAYDSDRNGDREIFILDLTTGIERQVTDNTADDQLPDWSPDGTRIAFESDRDGDAEIYIFHLESGTVEQVTDNTTQDSVPVWSPDGSRIAYESHGDGDAEIYILDLDSGSLEQVTDNDDEDWMPVWSPDGTRIAFSSLRDLDDWQIYILDLDSGTEQRVTHDDGDKIWPAWS